MDTIAPSFASRSSATRSAVSNGSRILSGVDGRSASARRYRDLAKALADDLGGEAGLSEPQRAMVRHAAAVILESETMQTAIVRGDKVDHEQLVRVSNLLARLMKQLGIKSGVPKTAEPDLQSYLAGAAGSAA